MARLRNKYTLKTTTEERPKKIEVHLTEAENAELKKRFPVRQTLARHIRAILGFDN